MCSEKNMLNYFLNLAMKIHFMKRDFHQCIFSLFNICIKIIFSFSVNGSFHTTSDISKTILRMTQTSRYNAHLFFYSRHVK